MMYNKKTLTTILVLFFGWTIYANFGYYFHSDDIWATRGFKRIKKVGKTIIGTDFKKYRFPEFCRIYKAHKENKGYEVLNCINNMELISLGAAGTEGIYRGMSNSNETVCEMNLDALEDGSYLGCSVAYIDASVADSIELGEARLYAMRKKDPIATQHHTATMKKLQNEIWQEYREKEAKKALEGNKKGWW